MPEKVLIIGCGDIGRRAAKLWQSEGYDIFGIVRSDASARVLRQQEIEPIPYDLDFADNTLSLPLKDSLVFYFIPPDRSGHRDNRMRHFLASIKPKQNPKRIIYISTSGVYGDCRGNWVTEESPVNPMIDRSRRRVDAERALSGWAKKSVVSIVTLRVPGIYGPNRLPIQRIQAGEPVLRQEDAPWTNRIHADDLARVAVQAAKTKRPDRVYNISDGNPGTVTEYYNTVADAIQLPRPPTISMEKARRIFSPMRLSFLAESRRLDNRRMLGELNIVLRYPTMKEGIPASI